MYDCLVMSAGGTYGATYVGAIRALEARGVRNRIRRVHGTSAGSIVAAMTACGLGSDEMLDVMRIVCSEKRPSPDLRRLGRTFGCSDIRKFLGKALDAFLPPDATFSTLARTGAGVNLSVHAFNVPERRLVDFGLESTPDADVRDAIAASCCVPLLFQPVVIDGVSYVDGGVAQRTPMHMIVDPKTALVLDVRDGKRGEPKDVFEFVAALTSATSRHVGPFAGDFVTIQVPDKTPTIADLPVCPDSVEPLVAAGYAAVMGAMDSRASC